jgi:Spx/MgsR family transcriptional regulator
MNGITVFGIVHCDTVKRARAWLAGAGVEFVFHDFRKSGVPQAQVDAWLGAVGWERLLNRQGTTWRKLDEARRAAVVDARGARALMLEQPSVIKRPVVQWADGAISVGFDAGEWSRRIGR